MFPRVQERFAISDAVEEYTAFPQFWDDERRVSLEVKERIVPAFDGDLPWDLYVLFDRDARWANAGDHVIGWGAPVIERADELDAQLAALAPGSGPR